MADVVLLGAGASVEAGIPASLDMTKELAATVTGKRRAIGAPDLASALHFVCAALLLHDGAEGASPFRGLDVERVFAAVALLAERSTLEVTPFVSAWHPAVDRWDPDDRNTFALLADRMLSELRGLVSTEPRTCDYLAPLALAGERPGGLTVATLNCDRTVEQACAVAGINVDTGIVTWVNTGQWDWASSGMRLLKLHGSMDWSWQDDPRRAGHLPSRCVIQSADPDADGLPPVVIFGHRGKLRGEGPFLSLLAEFERLLASTARLVVIGYSFRDDHVNQVIRRWTFERPREVVIVDPNWSETCGEKAIQEAGGMRGLDPTKKFAYDLDFIASGLRPHGEAGDHLKVTVVRERASESITDLF